MKKFIYKLLIFSLIPLISLIGVCFLVDGSTDPFYLRFTTPKQQNLILGTSRAAQGLHPKVFRDIMGVNIYNYAFTIAHSPYGKVYLESIKEKHNKKENGIFILTVDPWSISNWNNSANDLSKFRENDLFLKTMNYVAIYPNFEYIYENFSNLEEIFDYSRTTYLHENGWLEIKNIPMDSLSLKKRINSKVKVYKYEHLPKTNYSNIRFEFLMKTICYLSGYGEVYLVRLPIHPDMMVVENALMPKFDSVIGNAIEISDGYLDLTKLNSSFRYTDGNHLHKTSGKKISKIIANWIKEKEQRDSIRTALSHME